MNHQTITFFNPETKETQRLDHSQFKDLWKEPLGFFWIDINSKDTAPLEACLKDLPLECVWSNHFHSPEILPHLHDTPHAVSFYLYDIDQVETLGDTEKSIKELSEIPLLVIVSERVVITYHQRNLDLIDFLNRDHQENFKLAGQTPAFIIFLLFQHSLYHFARLNLVNDNFLDLLEFGVISGKVTEYMPKISTAGFNILMLKKLNANLHIILLMLVSKQSYFISHEARKSFSQILSDTISVREAIDSSRDLLDSIIAGIQAESTHKTGEIIRVLTIISAIFMPLTLISGIFGMNFHHAPGLTSEIGFYLTLLGMLVVAGVFLLCIQYLGWIGKKKPKNPHQRKRAKS